MTKEALEVLAVVYTAKTSNADSPEQFLRDYAANEKLFSEAKKKLDAESKKSNFLY